MYEICVDCGKHIPDADIDPDGPYIICDNCGFRQPFRMLPLFIITGASGTGKTSLSSEIALMDEKPDLIYLDSDMLLIKEFTGSGWQEYRDIWLWVCLNISQSGRPVALFGSASPSDFENAPRRKYFSAIHYLALTCDRGVLEQRLVQRPEWRQSSSPEFVKRHLEWNQWFIDNASTADPPHSILDTTDKTLQEAIMELFAWIDTCL
jgi:DNA-directed RNA polymerase subunit RPC12/RpoP